MSHADVSILVIGKKEYRDCVISEALKVIEEEASGLVLFNIGEPKMADLEFVARLRVGYSFEDLPIVVVTDRADGNLIVRMLEIGAKVTDVLPGEIGEIVTAFLKKDLEAGSLEVRRSQPHRRQAARPAPADRLQQLTWVCASPTIT